MSDVSNEEMAAIKKTSRAKSNRSATERRKPWQPPSKLDAPEAPEGFKHRNLARGESNLFAAPR